MLAYIYFPREHRAKTHSSNPIERLNGEIKRRTDVIRIVGAILIEQSDEWAMQRARDMTLETITALGAASRLLPSPSLVHPLRMLWNAGCPCKTPVMEL